MQYPLSSEHKDAAMDDKEYWMPKNLDAPPLFFVWEADTAVLWIFWVFMGAMLNMFVLGLAFAVIFSKGYSYLKEEGGKGLIMKLLYWYTPSDMWVDKAPSHIREYIGG